MDQEVLQKFANLDDFDIISALKDWQNHPDFVLSNLSKMIINRDLPTIKISADKFPEREFDDLMQLAMQNFGLSMAEAKYFVFKGKIKNQAYNKLAQPINILHKNGDIKEIVTVSDQLNVSVLTKPLTKFYGCYPKKIVKN